MSNTRVGKVTQVTDILGKDKLVCLVDDTFGPTPLTAYT